MNSHPIKILFSFARSISIGTVLQDKRGDETKNLASTGYEIAVGASAGFGKSWERAYPAIGNDFKA
jgi:hypothetical protein